MGKKVLIVDDSATMRQMITIVLKGSGYDVSSVPDGEAALEAFDESIDLVITDYNMPRMNGVELVDAIRSGTVNSDVMILMATTESEATQSQGVAVDRWLQKPFAKQALVEAVHDILA